MNYYRIRARAHNKIRSFYVRVARKYCHTYSIELMRRNISDAINGMYKIENGLLRRKPIISRWDKYWMANCGKWYYAYTLSQDKQGNDIVTVVDARHGQNMHESIQHLKEYLTEKYQDNKLNNTKQTFRLTESQLHNVIKESVKQALSEGYLNGSYYDEYEYYPSEDEIEQERREDIINGKKMQKFAEKIIRFSEKLVERYFDEGRWSNPAARVFYYTLTPSMNGLCEFVKNCKEGYYF